MRRLGIALAAAALASGTGEGRAAAPLRVVATVKPVHSLVASVMEGVGSPALLLTGAASPHAYSLRPSDASSLAGARVIFWVGEALETFLSEPLRSLAPAATIVELARAPGVTLLPGRTGGFWEGHEEGHAPAGGEAGRPSAGSLDGHIWLDPDNARRIVEAAAAALERADPEHGDRYRENARRTVARIDALDADLAGRLAGVRTVPYVVFHDAYRYFERRYGLAAVGSVTVSPERPPGARRIAEARRRLRTLEVRCVFAEPQFEPRLVGTLVEGTPVGTGTLDPLGAAVPAGPDAWFAVMRNLADALVGCLTAP